MKIIMHFWSRSTNTLALAILVILLSNTVTKTEQRSISTRKSPEILKMEVQHKTQIGPMWLIPRDLLKTYRLSRKITGKQHFLQK